MTTHTKPQSNVRDLPKHSVTPDGTRWVTYSDGSRLGITVGGGMEILGARFPYWEPPSTKTSRPEGPPSL